MYVIKDMFANKIFDIIDSFNIDKNSHISLQKLKYWTEGFLVKLDRFGIDEKEILAEINRSISEVSKIKKVFFKPNHNIYAAIEEMDNNIKKTIEKLINSRKLMDRLNDYNEKLMCIEDEHNKKPDCIKDDLKLDLNLWEK